MITMKVLRGRKGEKHAHALARLGKTLVDYDLVVLRNGRRTLVGVQNGELAKWPPSSGTAFPVNHWSLSYSNPRWRVIADLRDLCHNRRVKLKIV